MHSDRRWRSRPSPSPLLGTGEVIVDVAASRVLAYANEVLSGERKYLLELPDRARPRRDRPHPRHRPRRDPASSRRLGLLRSDRALTRQCAVARHRPAGPHRRQRGRPAPATLFPRRRLGRTNAAADGKRDSDRRHRRRRTPADGARSARCSCPMAGSSPRTCKPGRSRWSMAPLAASGSAAVAVALGMGAQCVVATGRNEQALTELTRRFGARVRPCRCAATRLTIARASCRRHPARSTACSTSSRPRPMPCRCGPPSWRCGRTGGWC